LKFVIATNNEAKLKELRAILGGLGFDAVSQSEAGVAVEPEETGETFYENALIKARAVCKASGLPAIADDSGLCVDALDGAPGVLSARYGGDGLGDMQRYVILLDEMTGVKQRGARFVSSIVCVFPDGEILSARGECLGVILDVPRGSGGFGYDPVFMPDGLDCSMAELSPEEKNEISHRGVALRQMASMLAKRFPGGAGAYDDAPLPQDCRAAVGAGH
jgi:XTP/dITP diphosphohydrolase